ncbi:hypothetical protein HC031_01185 [Planosporangium thailandense]|uniref:Glycosyltransferase RgtA/B/C/D-like domain-containing protein n=1 Tax=Planosporangium thailandense TaxID=765197 RepID=A0ABX0XQS8_9ACTN|nr:hypothetical protein [Planosporangium thailandense]NJC68340.1 hypothetical protein [Planosporangium thailandense]
MIPDLKSSAADPVGRDAGAPSDRPSWWRGPRTPRAFLIVLALLVAAWVVPVVCLALRIGWILPLLIWIGTASLIRSGRTLLDRLVLALGLLVGVVCTVGLPLSLWSGALEPLQSTGLALTSLVVAGAVAGRRPALPVRELGVPEYGVIAGTLVTAALAVRPFLGRGFGDRLSILAIGGALARHFTIYDTIRTVGGYLFLHRGAPMPNIDAGYDSYPQGVHFIYALLANLMPQGADRANAVASFDLMITFDIGTYVFLCVATLWAMRWVAGPLLRGWVSLPFIGAVSGYLFFGDPITLLTRGFPSEMAGWGLLALLVALVIRPVHRVREQIVLVASLLIGVSFAYFLFLPFAGLAALVWLIRDRRTLLRRPILLGVTAVVCLVGAAVSPVVNTVYSPQGVGERLLLPGGITKVDRAVVVAWLLIALAGPILRFHKRSRIWRTTLVLIVVSTLPAAGLFVDQVLSGHANQTYYLDKLFHEMFVVTVVSSGSVILVLAPMLAAVAQHRIAVLAGATALSGAMFFAVTNLQYDGPVGTGRRHFQQKNAVWGAGQGTTEAIRLFPRPDGRITWVQLNSRADLGGRDASHWATLYTSVLQHNYRASWSVFYWGYPWLSTSEAETAEFLMTSPEPYRVLVNDTVSLEYFSRIKSRYPTLDLQIVDLRGRK